MFEIMRRNNDHSVNAYNPFREMEDFERSFFNHPFGGFFDSRELAAFKTDVSDDGDHYLLEADLPGFEKKDIHLDLNGDVLTISAERHSNYEDKDKKGNFLRCERSYGSYARSFDISGIDAAQIKAAYNDGVLRVTLPKQTQVPASTRRLEIE